MKHTVPFSKRSLIGRLVKIFPIMTLFSLWAGSVFAQNYPDTLKIAVTYYDFHSNGSNPEFEKTPTASATHRGMVQDTLDADRKPILGPVPYWNCQIAKWFRPYVQFAPGNYIIPNYTNPTTTTCSNPLITVTYDTAFKNIVFQDTLPFIIQNRATGTYQFYSANFFPLDNRGFGLEGQQHNYSFSMELHRAFRKVPGLTFQFEGDDDVWAFINNRLVMDIGGIHNTTPGSVNVDTLGLTDNKQYMFDFFYCERHVTGSDIRITTNLISPAPESLSMTARPSNDTIAAGDSVVYSAIVKDDTGGVRPEYSNYINWTLRATSADTLRATNGANNTFKGITAWRWDTITARFTDPTNPSRILTHIAIVWVKPDTAYRVYIVGIGDTMRTAANQNNPRPLDRVTMDSATNHDTVYAVLYDKYGNWVGKADNAVWASLNQTIVATNGVQNKNFMDTIDRVTKNHDSTYVTAKQTGLIGDSVLVVLQTGTIIAVRLVDNNGNQVTSVAINTDQTQFLQIQVKWSNDTSTWVNGAGSWTLNPNTIQWVNPPPLGNQTGNWTLDPKTPGQTNLTVLAGNQSIIIPITITVADPNRIALNILTPANSLIAGDTIMIEQRIYNTDGLVPNYPDTVNWCKGATAYSDTLVNRKLPNWVPTITLPGASGGSSITFGSIGTPCFQNGIDTIKVVLYDAPYTQDTLHQVSVLLTTGSNTIKGATTPFILLPAPLDSISIEDANFKAITGPVTLNYPGGMQFFYSNGYDRYQNLIGHTNSSWSVTGTLNAITPPDTGIFRIYYEAVDANEQGFIVTQAPSLANIGNTVSDSVAVTIIGSQAVIDSAITKDLNGNGYLDHIYVYFNKPASITSDYSVSNITLRYSTTTLVIDSIRPLNDSSYIIFLLDTVNAQKGIITAGHPAPQTGWRPLLTMNNLPGGVKVANYTCRDGAGPVIWRVLVDRKNANDRTQDLVTVTFSEPIKSGITGDAFQMTTAPGSVFTVWDTANGAFTKVDNALVGIGNFNSSPDDSTLTFLMTNGRELFSKYYFNLINNNGTSYISDKSSSKVGNLPVADNQKVQVEILGASGTLTVAPNPLMPTTDHAGPGGAINFNNEPNAVTWVNTVGGTIFRLTVSPGSPGEKTTITGYLKVYDVVGNLVNEGESQGNMLDQVKENTTPTDSSHVYYYDVYWNGTNSHGMKAAPGAYLGIYYTTTTKNNGSTTSSIKTRQVQKVGVRRGGSS